MEEIDFYIYCFDNFIFNKFKSIKLDGYKCNFHQIVCYHNSPINGLITENIFFQVYDNQYSCKMISKNIHNPNKIFAIIIPPENQSYQKTLETFICMNFHNTEYLKQILKNDYYDIFDRSKIVWGNLKKNFNQCYQSFKGDDLFLIQKNYNNLINNFIPFPYIILQTEQIEYFIQGFTLNRYNDIVNNYNKRNENNLEKGTIFQMETSIINKSNIKYLCYATIGMGDFIQRFERLYKLLNFSDNNFIPIRNKNMSYNNPNHGDTTFLTMYDFPAFEFMEINDNISKNSISCINFQNLFELIMYDKNYFTNFNENIFLYINIGSFINNFNNRNLIKKIFNWTNNQEIIKEVTVPYSIPDWKLNWNSKNKLLILHFRRGDYIDQILSNHPRPRTISTFNYLIKNINIKESEIDVVIISDHYDISKIPTDKQKYIPILFDYNMVDINTTIEINNTKYIIRDKVIGTNGECNLKTLKYISQCDYHTGNMSCFPVIMGKIFNSKKINHIRHNDPNIKNMQDLINISNKK